jgi:demethylmenaquinone methyltransferase/2-methoxy-6-polyprenyl-1,4-benzoquinol methylase
MPISTNAADVPRALFTGIAASYDRPAHLLSYLQYQRWHRFLLSRLQLSPPARVLDMASGTGAIALQLAQRPGIEVAACDITRPMLLQAQARACRDGLRPAIDLIECSAEAVPFPDATFDAVIFAYLLRYVSDVPATLRGLARVLRPGGTMLSLDFAVPRGPAYPLWRVHTDIVLPLGGAVLSPGWRRVGRFLGPSIRQFDRHWPEERLLALWRECGFPNVQAKRLSLGGALVAWGTKSR